MNPFSEVFLEQDADDVKQVHQTALKRVAELESQGFQCTLGLFYNILTGNRIYILDAAPLESINSETVQQNLKPRSHSKRSPRPNSSRPSNPKSQ